MILVDTSIWIDFLRRGDEILTDLLQRRFVLTHPFIVGEIALGGIEPDVLGDLLELPAAKVATAEEVFHFIGRFRLAGKGIGYVDAHLLASARLTPDALLWTRDKSMRSVAEDMNLFAEFAN